jgi:magnesium chelatase family protein
LRYRKKISGPLLDRIDLHVEVPRVKFDKLANEEVAESSKNIRERVQAARERQLERFHNLKILTNAEMSAQQLKTFCPVDAAGQDLLRKAVDEYHLSARTYHRILKVARTIADLAGSEPILPQHLAEAIQYRVKGDEEKIF